jgi:hypothetical protein
MKNKKIVSKSGAFRYASFNFSSLFSISGTFTLRIEMEIPEVKVYEKND